MSERESSISLAEQAADGIRQRIQEHALQPGDLIGTEADLAEVVNATTAADIHTSITEFEAGYDTLVGERGVTLRCDGEQLKQVFLNLGLNALQAMPDGGTLTIRSERGGTGRAPEVQVSFTDDGEGMTREEMRHLFTPFRSTKKGGSGLGLAIADRIVRDHRGLIRVSSERGEGAVFTVCLPCGGEEEEADA